MTSSADGQGPFVSRTCRLAQVTSFSADQLIAELLEGQQCEGDFCLLESQLTASSMTRMRVVGDDSHVHVGVLLWETLGFGQAAKASLNPQGAGQNVVEILWSPWNDRQGFLQYGAGPNDDLWFNSHWPYRDERDDLSARPRFEVNWHVRAYGEDVARIAIFSFKRQAILPTGAKRVGLNVMRSELRNEENSVWVPHGSSFADPACMGLLIIGDEPAVAPRQDTPADTQADAQATAPLRKQSASHTLPQLAVTYDFPDEALNAPYTPEMLRLEMATLRDAGVTRIDWIDYPFWCESFSRLADEGDECAKSLPYGPEKIRFARQTCEAFDCDVLGHAASIARELGLSFHVVIKPFDLWPKWTMPHASPQQANTSLNGRHVAWGDPFLEAHGDQYAFATNPAWQIPTHDVIAKPVTQLLLWSDNESPLPFDAKDMRIWVSDDNVNYRMLEHCQVHESIETRQRHTYGPAGMQAQSADQQHDGHERVRCIRLTGFEITSRYFAIETPDAKADVSADRHVFPNDFGNQRFSLIQAFGDDEKQIPATVGWQTGHAKRGRFEFNYSSNKAEWACVTEAAQRRTAMTPGTMLPVALAQDQHMAGMLEPTFSEVQDYWLKHYIQRAIDVKADGVDVRIAQHQGCSNWLEYGWAAPVLKAFEAQFGRAPQPVDKDYQAMRRIRGQAYTQWLKRCKAKLADAGMTLEHHLEARMVVEPEHDTYLQIHWDWQKWLDDDLIDGLNLKYIGANHPWLHDHVLPRARPNKAGRRVAIRVIDAPLDVRNHPRALEAHGQYLQQIQAAGLDGLSLYEAWTYLRTTPDGDLVLRGSAGPIFKQFAAMLGR